MVKTAKFSSNLSDPIADLLTRIRNANQAQKDDLEVPVSKTAKAILEILTAQGYVEGFAHEGEGVDQAYRVTLKYGPRRQRTISGLKRVSKPGRRIYRGRQD